MQIIKTEKEPRYKVVSVSELQTGDWIEVNNELACVMTNNSNTNLQLFYPRRNYPENHITYFDSSCFNKDFPTIYLCDTKIIYERMLF